MRILPRNSLPRSMTRYSDFRPHDLVSFPHGRRLLHPGLGGMTRLVGILRKCAHLIFASDTAPISESSDQHSFTVRINTHTGIDFLLGISNLAHSCWRSKAIHIQRWAVIHQSENVSKIFIKIPYLQMSFFCRDRSCRPRVTSNHYSCPISYIPQTPSQPQDRLNMTR